MASTDLVHVSGELANEPKQRLMRNGNLLVEDATVLFANFAGEEKQFNKLGDRNFCIVIEDYIVAELLANGWNVKTKPPREEGDLPRHIMKVSVGFGKYPPKIVMVTSRNSTEMTEDLLDMLDAVEIETVDIIIRPYSWDVNGKKGVKAYTKTLYMVIAEDYLERKYAHYHDPHPVGPAAIAELDDPNVIDVEFFEEEDVFE